MFTTKLAIYYFRRQPLGSTRDRCLILIGSIAGYLGIPSSATYSMSKFGVDSIRVNLVAPGYVITPAYTKEIIAFFKSKGVKFASEDDACKAVLRIASDTAVNGRSLAVVSKEDCAEGYFDLAQDDFSEGSKLHGMQDVALNVGSRT
ncbi:short chain dehydrogenase/reductase [Blastomyces gilchristii SLH14081]|uniref:Short chain dehydrogenase/reductase n=1 Tax=Blastomyces gilchristii (strain SLH14081) TaxID=559298 RepID=A0A179UVZ4_BLAGS|nr:short chain dehydrogenase/reductase [Blastomyces gilchristii SLH14081]OAT11221.1 short chain dehydrogenase/reductase [Blastomyces gilchristii SLH14081]